MGTRYRHLTIEERCELARLHTEGHSVRQIAASLDRSPSTVARELKRNGSKTQGYQPSYAQQQARARRWTGSRLDGNDELRQQVLSRLGQGWSPQQVAGRLALESGRTVISPRDHLPLHLCPDWQNQGLQLAPLPEPSPNADGGDARAAVPPLSLPTAAPSRTAPRRPPTAGRQDTGRPT